MLGQVVGVDSSLRSLTFENTLVVVVMSHTLQPKCTVGADAEERLFGVDEHKVVSTATDYLTTAFVLIEACHSVFKIMPCTHKEILFLRTVNTEFLAP